MEIVHGAGSLCLSLSLDPSVDWESPGVRPSCGQACTSATTSQVRVEIRVRNLREARLAWWDLESGLVVGIACLLARRTRGHFPALRIGALRCS